MRILRYAVLSALGTACAAFGGRVSSATAPFADIGEAVIVAFAAAPIDSLCHAAFCDAVLVDTLVRRAPAIGTYQLERLPVVGSVCLSRLVETMDSSIPLRPARFRHQGVEGDTASVGLGVVWSGEDVPASLTVLMPIELADSYGGVFFVSLERRNGRWYATRVVFEEA